jgi:hypothetical protein
LELPTKFQSQGKLRGMVEWQITLLVFPSASSSLALGSEHSGGGGMEATSLGGGVLGRGGRPSSEMLWGNGALPRRESGFGAPPRHDSIFFSAMDDVSRTPTLRSFRAKVLW